MRILVLATGPFVQPTLELLLESTHEVRALVTKPPHGRRPQEKNPLRVIAEQHGLAIFDPEDVNLPEAQERLRQWEADLLVVCDYGRILSAETLTTARHGGLNLHGSLLPKYRGAAPINWALYHGETETGVSVIHITPAVDAGPIVGQRATPIEPDETTPMVEDRLARLGAPLVLDAIDQIAAGRCESIPQDPTLASRAPRLKKSDGLVDWTRSAEDIRNQVRAMEPWPKTFTVWHRPDGEPMRWILGRVEPSTLPAGEEYPPGTIISVENDEMRVATSEGCVVISQLQPAGKRMLTTAEFLRGHRVEPGQRLG